MEHPTFLIIALALVAGVLATGAGGAVGGIVCGGKAIGIQLAAMMGLLYGMLGAAPAVVIGVVVITLLR